MKKIYLLLPLIGLMMMSCDCHSVVPESVTIKSSSEIDESTGIWTSYSIANGDTVCKFVLDNTKVKVGESFTVQAFDYQKVSDLKATITVNDGSPVQIESYPYMSQHEVTHVGLYSVSVTNSFSYKGSKGTGMAQYVFTVSE